MPKLTHLWRKGSQWDFSNKPSYINRHPNSTLCLIILSSKQADPATNSHSTAQNPTSTSDAPTKQALAFTNPNHNSKRNLATASSSNSSRAPTRSSTPASFQPFPSKANPQTQACNRFNKGPYYQSKDQIINGLCYYH